jgi:ABC-2 type transport system ATP-binding protein
MLHVGQLRKSYGVREALRGVDLDVAAGEVVALLGPNGAGKTTLVSIVAGLRRPDAGVVEVGGIDATTPSREVRRLLGLAPQETGLYPVVTVRQNLTLFGSLAGLRGRELRRRVDEVAEALSLTDLLGRQAGKLSGGQKRRVHTAMAFVHRPSLLLLDEATTGADVETRAHILELVTQMAAEGTAVVYSTHYLAEVGALPATLAILDEGRVLARGTLEALETTYAQAFLELTFHGRPPDVAGVTAQRVDDRRLRIPTDDPGATLAELVPTLPPGSLAGVDVVRPDVESVYLALTGRRFDEADAAGTSGAPQESGAADEKGRSDVTAR